MAQIETTSVAIGSHFFSLAKKLGSSGIRQPYAVSHFTGKPLGAIECGFPTQVIIRKFAANELTIQESAFCETYASKVAIFKLGIYEQAPIEEG